VRDITHENEVDRMKSEFLATAAHELRTPMASIQGFSELLLNTDYALAERQEMLAIIHRQSELMAAIINELLDLVRIEERRGKDFTLEALDGGELVAEAIANFRLPAGRQPPLIRTHPCRLQADRQKLLQVSTTFWPMPTSTHRPAAVTVALDSEATRSPSGSATAASA
jgi:signal transduction histidine kinase